MEVQLLARRVSQYIVMGSKLQKSMDLRKKHLKPDRWMDGCKAKQGINGLRLFYIMEEVIFLNY